MDLKKLYKGVGLLLGAVDAVQSLPVFSMGYRYCADDSIAVIFSVKPDYKVDYNRLLDEIFDLSVSARELGYDLEWSEGHLKTDHRFSFVFNKFEDYGKKKKKK